jgi:parvulin-like peptidyl-prolyl isomerase
MVEKKVAFLHIMLCLLLSGVLVGCSSVGTKKDVLAVVNGVPVTEDDLAFALDIEHRREKLGAATSVDVTGYLEKLISDLLIAEEARRMGLEQTPEIQDKVQAFIKQQSVMKLHEEEIVRKVSVSEDEVREYYFRYYETFTVGLIEVENEELADELLLRIEKGEDLGQIAREHSTHHSAQNDGVIVYTKKAVESSPRFEEIIQALEPGQTSEPEELLGKYYIVQLKSREDAPSDEFEKTAPEIKALLKKEKKKAREDEYLQQLRSQADIEIHDDVLATLNMEEYEQKKDEWLNDARVLARVHDKVLTVADLIESLQKATGKKMKAKKADTYVNNWIDFRVVDHEAIRRQYVNEPKLRAEMERYIDQLVRRMFIQTAIYPNINVSDESVSDYYASHQDRYRTPVSYRFEEISVSTREEADDIMDSLEKGSDFLWMAKQNRGDAEMPGRSEGWILESQLPPYIRDLAGSMAVGDISPVQKVDDANYIILRMSAKKGGETRPLESIKRKVVSDYVSDQVQSITADYVERLKEDAEIIVHHEAIEALDKKFNYRPSLDITQN